MNDNDEKLQIIEEALDENVSMQRRSASEFDDLKNFVQAKFSTLYDINKITRGLNGLKKRSSEISNGVERISYVNKTHLNNFVEMDIELARKIDELEMSHDFTLNNSLETNSFNKIIIEKMDGKSVNEGDKNVEQVENVGESSIKEMHSLTDLTKEPITEQKAEEINGIDKVSLEDIANGNEVVEQRAEEMNDISKIALGDIANNDN